jgi:hypothetical protein
MPDEVTVNQLFDLAIAAERAAEGVYRRLQAMFAPHPDVVRFWSDYAMAEDSHAQWLERIRGSVDAEQLAAPADPHTVRSAQALLRFPVEQALQGINTLDDAYQLASEMESGETNVVFDFLIGHFASDSQAQGFMRSQLKDHISKISTGFPARFRSSASRLSVKAIK